MFSKCKFNEKSQKLHSNSKMIRKYIKMCLFKYLCSIAYQQFSLKIMHLFTVHAIFIKVFAVLYISNFEYFLLEFCAIRIICSRSMTKENCVEKWCSEIIFLSKKFRHFVESFCVSDVKFSPL